MRLLYLISVIAILEHGLNSAPLVAQDSNAIDYERMVAPIFARRCLKCHGSKSPEGELSLVTPKQMIAGGQSGRLLVPRNPDRSLLWQYIRDNEMPPADEPQLTKSERTTIRGWIETGAKLPGPDTFSELVYHDQVDYFLRLRCATCHGRQIQRAGLDVRTVDSLLKGGTSGPAIVAGKPDASRLLTFIHEAKMPPRDQLVKYSVKPMPANEIQLLTRWIADGARQREIQDQVVSRSIAADDDKLWAFRAPQRPELPNITGVGWTKNAVDAFIRARLEDAGVAPAPAAPPAAFIRRAYFDLIGLAPPPHEVQDFIRRYESDADLAVAELVDKLLASPQYGERWGGFWLDLAGYSDSEGIQHSDPIRPHVYRYRNYVIRAFNQNKPYDRFLLEQIAGDELADYESGAVVTQELYDNLVATSFLKLGPDGTFTGITGFVPDRLDAIDQSLEVLTSGVIGLTLKCARCHSHKFDPLSQQDYYRLAAVFKGALDEHDWLMPIDENRPPGIGVRYLEHVTAAERRAITEHDARVDAKISRLKSTKKADGQTLDAKMLADRIKKLESQKRHSELFVRAVWDRGDPSPTYVLQRGNYLTPGKRVAAGVPAVLQGVVPFESKLPWPNANKTGNRLGLAKWLTDRKHPLTSRVFVNRLWHHHFGTGIVATLDDFGAAGARPSHPQLLDWLALEFIDSGWDIKSMHRIMMNSATYRQSSRIVDEINAPDSDEQLWNRMPLRRRDAESLRDTLLQLSGRLALVQGGKADPITMRDDGLVTADIQQGTYRRSIYLLKRRTQPVTFLANFDRPPMNPNCVQRNASIVAPQALHLMNSARIRELAATFAERVHTNGKASPPRELVERAFWLSLSRPPGPEEWAELEPVLQQLVAVWQAELATSNKDETATREQALRRALTSVCHALLNSAELLFVD